MSFRVIDVLVLTVLVNLPRSFWRVDKVAGTDVSLEPHVKLGLGLAHLYFITSAKKNDS